MELVLFLGTLLVAVVFFVEGVGVPTRYPGLLRGVVGMLAAVLVMGGAKVFARTAAELGTRGDATIVWVRFWSTMGVLSFAAITVAQWVAAAAPTATSKYSTEVSVGVVTLAGVIQVSVRRRTLARDVLRLFSRIGPLLLSVSPGAN